MFPAALAREQKRSGAVRRGGAEQGRVRRDWVRYGDSCRRQHRGLRAPLLLSLESRFGRACIGEVWSGEARFGQAR